MARFVSHHASLLMSCASIVQYLWLHETIQMQICCVLDVSDDNSTRFVFPKLQANSSKDMQLAGVLLVSTPFQIF